jgi:hypothetical protein
MNHKNAMISKDMIPSVITISPAAGKYLQPSPGLNPIK